MMHWTMTMTLTLLLVGSTAQAQPTLTPPAARDLPLLCTSYALFAVEMARWRDTGSSIMRTHASILAWDTSKGFTQDIQTIHAQIIWYVYSHPRIPSDMFEVLMYASCEAWRQGQGLFPANAQAMLDVMSQADALGRCHGPCAPRPR
jgi:hypothetical protein